MDGGIGVGSDTKKTKIIKSFKGEEVVESHICEI